MKLDDHAEAIRTPLKQMNVNAMNNAMKRI